MAEHDQKAFVVENATVASSSTLGEHLFQWVKPGDVITRLTTVVTATADEDVFFEPWKGGVPATRRITNLASRAPALGSGIAFVGLTWLRRRRRAC